MYIYIYTHTHERVWYIFNVTFFSVLNNTQNQQLVFQIFNCSFRRTENLFVKRKAEFINKEDDFLNRKKSSKIPMIC